MHNCGWGWSCRLGPWCHWRLWLFCRLSLTGGSRWRKTMDVTSSQVRWYVIDQTEHARDGVFSAGASRLADAGILFSLPETRRSIIEKESVRFVTIRHRERERKRLVRQPTVDSVESCRQLVRSVRLRLLRIFARDPKTAGRHLARL